MTFIRTIKIFSAIALHLTATGCANEGIRGRIADLADKKCGQSHVCEIDLGDMAPAKWDKFYVFFPGTHEDDLNRIAGVKYDDHDTIMERALFVSNDHITEAEEIVQDYDGRRGRNVNFAQDPKLGYFVIDRNHPKVKIEIREDENPGVFFSRLHFGSRRTYSIDPA